MKLQKKYKAKLWPCQYLRAAQSDYISYHPNTPRWLSATQPIGQYPRVCSLRPTSHLLIQKNIQKTTIFTTLCLGSTPKGILSPLFFLSTPSLPEILTVSHVLNQNPHPVCSFYCDPDAGRCGFLNAQSIQGFKLSPPGFLAWYWSLHCHQGLLIPPLSTFKRQYRLSLDNMQATFQGLN